MSDEIAAIVVDCYTRALAERGSGTTGAAIDDETTLFGSDAELDSMGLVSLVLDVEEQLADRLGLEITIMDDKALSRRRSPFRTIGALTAYVRELAAPVPAAVG